MVLSISIYPSAVLNIITDYPVAKNNSSPYAN